MGGRETAFGFKSHQIKFLFPAKPDFFVTWWKLAGFWCFAVGIKELSDTSADSVIESSWEELQGTVAEISEALHGNRNLGRPDCHIFT